MIPLGILAASAPVSAGAYELIATQSFGTTQTSITFSSIPQTYKHLELRFVAKNGSTTQTNMFVNFNGSSTGYAWHSLYGSGTAVYSTASSAQTRITIPSCITNYTAGAAWGSGIISILDYRGSGKNKTTRTSHGEINNFVVALTSGLWANTAAITSITLAPPNGNFAIGSRFSLYGIKG